MVDLQTISWVAAAVSVILGVIYYAFNMRTTLETRQASLFMQLYNVYDSKEFLRDYTDVCWRHEYSDISDWMQKYHPQKNPEAYASFMRLGRFYEGVGILVEKKLISMDLVVELMREAILFSWERLKTYAYGQREITHMPIWAHFEKLAVEVRARQPKASPADSVLKTTKDLADRAVNSSGSAK
jgi:hypothetical protein